MRRAKCSSNGLRESEKGGHSVEIVGGVAAFHYAIPGLSTPCPGSQRPPAPGNRLPWEDRGQSVRWFSE